MISLECPLSASHDNPEITIRTQPIALTFRLRDILPNRSFKLCENIGGDPGLRGLCGLTAVQPVEIGIEDRGRRENLCRQFCINGHPDTLRAG